MKRFHLNGFLRRGCSAVLALALCMPPAVLADEGKARIQTSQTILDGLKRLDGGAVIVEK